LHSKRLGGRPRRGIPFAHPSGFAWVKLPLSLPDGKLASKLIIFALLTVLDEKLKCLIMRALCGLENSKHISGGRRTDYYAIYG